MSRKYCRCSIFLFCLSFLLLAEAAFSTEAAVIKTGKRIGLEDVLHPNTLLFVRAYDFSRLPTDLEGTALSQIAKHEEVAEFLDLLALRRDEFIDRVSAESKLDRETVAAFTEGQIAVAYRGLEPKKENLYLGISFPQRPDRDQLFTVLTAIAQKIIDPDIPTLRSTDRGVPRLMLAMPDKNYFALMGNLLVVTSNEDGMKDMIDRYLAGGAQPVLAALPSFKRAVAGSRARPGSAFAYLNARLAMPALLAFTSPETVNFLDALGLRSVSDIGISSVFTGEGLRQTLYLHTPKDRTGILRVLAFAQGISTHASNLPDDFDSLLSARVDLLQLYREVPRFIDAFKAALPAHSPAGSAAIATGKPSAPGLASLLGENTILGIPVPEVLATLGDSIIIQPGPAGTAICFDRADSAAFEKLVSRMEAALHQQENGGAGEFTNLAEGDKVLRYFNQSGRPVPLAPSYVILNDHTILLATHPQVLKAILRHSSRGGAAKEGLRDFDRVMAGMPKDLGFLYYVNSRDSYARVYDALLPFLNVLTAFPSLALDPGLLPPGNELTPFFFGTAIGISNHPQGLTLTAYSPLGLGGVLVYGLDRLVVDNPAIMSIAAGMIMQFIDTGAKAAPEERESKVQ